MNLNIPPIITYLVSWFGLMGGVWTLFDRAETVVSKESKKKVTEWIKGVEISSRNEWPKTFVDAFNAVFGRRHFSLRCILGSAVASFSFALILLIFYMSLRPQHAREFFQADAIGTGILIVFLATATLNLVPDYFSLFETRLILRAMTKASSTWRILILIISDFILTTVIIIIVIGGFTASLGVSFDKIVEFFLTGLVLSAPEGELTFGIFIYTTYLTSFWIWIYVLALAVARILVRLERVWSWFKGFLNFTEKPLRSLGFLSMILVTVIYILIPLFRLFL